MSEDQTPFIHPIAKDPRPIIELRLAADPDGPLVSVGSDLHPLGKVTEIRAYEEPGQMAMVPFFAVYVGTHLHARVPAACVIIVYADPSPDPQP